MERSGARRKRCERRDEAPVAQRNREQLPSKESVGGSNPSRCTGCAAHRQLNQAERPAFNRKVAGSIPARCMTERLEAASGPVAQFGRGRRLRSGVLQVRILLGPLSEFARVHASAVAVAQTEERGPPKAEVEGSIPSRSADLKTEPGPARPGADMGPSSNGKTLGLHPGDEGSTPSGIHWDRHALVAQLAEARARDARRCRFESCLEHCERERPLTPASSRRERGQDGPQ